MTPLEQELLTTLSYLRPVPPMELRALGSGMLVQRFSSYPKAAEWAAAQDTAGARGVYAVMNPFSVAAIAAAAVDDAAVVHREWLLVDVDPVRPKNTNSSDDELDAAGAVADAIHEELVAVRGWPAPLRAMSGNGWHLLWRIDLPADGESKALVNGCLAALAARYGGEVAAIDRTVGNAARITKLYGTTARKALATAGRPQRKSYLIDPPDDNPVPVPLQLLYDLAAEVPEFGAEPAAETPPPRTEGRGSYDLGEVLSRVHVLRTHVKDGTEFRDIICPWSQEHSSTAVDTATVITRRLDTGGLGFKCLHDHCINRNWHDLRDVLGLETEKWKARKAQAAAVSVPVAQFVPPPAAAAPVTQPQDERQRLRSQRVTVCDVARFSEVTAAMDHYAAHGRMLGAITTGMPRLDAILLGGFRPGLFYLLGGVTGGGKTTLLLQMLFAAAEELEPMGRKVAVVSPEMGPESLDVRSYARAAGLALKQYRLSPEATKTAWAEKTIPQNVRASFNSADIEPFVEDEQPAILAVDYAQQAVDYMSERRHTALAQLGARCIRIAQECAIPVILGTQVNLIKDTREMEQRESRMLGHQADVILNIDVVYLPNEYDAEGSKVIKECWLRVDKHRHGPTGRVKMIWRPELFRFQQDPFQS